jgi:sugar lactone lactonase YvrE
VWFGDGRYVLWSDIPNNRIMRWDEEDRHDARLSQAVEFLQRSHARPSRAAFDLRAREPLNSPNDIVCKSDGSIWFYNPDGKLIGRINLPERCANLCFGGTYRNRLFMAASTSLYSLYVNAQGVLGG